MLTDGVHDTVPAVHGGVLGVFDGAADAVPCVPDGLLGVHGVVCFSVPVSVQVVITAWCRVFLRARFVQKPAI